MEKARYKILLIEDDKIDQMAFEQLVQEQELPYDCTIAGSVSEARSILASGSFDAVIADYALGDGTAFDILDLVKDAPVILVTGTGDEETAVKAWKAGAYDYLIKDIERNYLKAVPITVENAIGHRRTREQLQLLSSAVMSTDDSVYITDGQNKIIFVNKAFCRTYGYKQEEVIGKDGNILWIGKPEPETVQGKPQDQNTSPASRRGGARSVFRTRSLGSSWEVGFYHRRKDGGRFPVSLSRSIIRDSSGSEMAVVGVARDISERIRLEDELRSTNLELAGQSQLKSELAIILCRQLLSPLDGLKSIISDCLGGALGQIGSKLRKNLESAGKDIDRAGRIVGELLDISKLDVGKMELKRAELSFRSVVSQALMELAPLAAERNVELESFMPDSELTVNADYDGIARALTNLVGRAINSAGSKGHVSVRVKDIGNEIAVEVQDDGPSIKSGELDRIFDRFDRIRMALRSGREQELALGLPIAKELVEMHGGCMWAETPEQGEGNNICFTLPKTVVQEVVASATEKAEEH